MATSLQITTPAAAWVAMDAELAAFPKDLRAAHYQAVKSTATQGRNMIFARFKEQYPKVQKSKIESGDLTKRRRPIVSEVTKGDQPAGTISVRDYKIPMIAFGPSGGGAKIPSKAGGVKVTMDRGKGAEIYRHAFKARMRSGHVGIFLRKKGGPKQTLARAVAGVNLGPGASGYAARLPIRELFGPSMYDLVNVPAINAEVLGKLDGILVKNIRSQLAYRKSKLGIF